MTDVRQILRDALEAKGWSVQKLLDESGLDCGRVSLHRKIFGVRRGRRRTYQRINLEELATLTKVLDLTVEVRAAEAA